MLIYYMLDSKRHGINANESVKKRGSDNKMRMEGRRECLAVI